MTKNGFASGQYDYMKKMAQLYDKLQDDMSKKIFWARLQVDVTPDMERIMQLVESGGNRVIAWREPFEAASAEGKKVVLYGAGEVGKLMAEKLTLSHADFYAFCDRNKAGETFFGKPTISPQEIIANSEQYIIIIVTLQYHKEVYKFLQDNGFPMTSVFDWWKDEEQYMETAYREFPELFKRGTAIVDAGCYDGYDTIRFSQWCEGGYSKIYAFEPDEKNYLRCKENIEAANIPNVTLIQAGLSEFPGESSFMTSGPGSHLVEETEIKHNYIQQGLEHPLVQICALDNVVDTEIGLIKMDIEGAEFDALHGAKRVIQRDKPQLTICVYHRQGDVLAIMDYIHSLVPEYRFWLRHYGFTEWDTILYAAI